MSITLRDSHSVNDICNISAKFDVLSKDQEIDLLTKTQAGDSKSRDKLLFHNLRFIIKTAKQFQYRGVPLSDLIIAGCNGFLESVDRYNISYDNKLLAYSVWYIKDACRLEVLAFNRGVYKSIAVDSGMNKIYKISNDYFLKHGVYPNVEYLSEKTGFNPIVTAHYMVSRYYTLPIDSPISNDDYVTIESTVPGDTENDVTKSIDDVDLKTGVQDMIQSILNEREIKIVSQYYGLNGDEPMTLEAIGNDIGYTKERIRQIKDRALVKLKKYKLLENLKREFIYDER